MVSRRPVRLLATAGGATMLLLSLVPSAAADDPPVNCPHGICGANAVDPGNPGGTPTPTPDNPGGGSGAIDVAEASCSAVPLSPPPDPGSPWWGGHTASEGQVVRWE